MIIGKEFLYDLRVLIDVFQPTTLLAKGVLSLILLTRGTLTTFTREAIRPARSVDQRGPAGRIPTRPGPSARGRQRGAATASRSRCLRTKLAKAFARARG